MLSGLKKLLKDLAHRHIGQKGAHRWQTWRERSWCAYCGLERR